jgi:glycosyltransferase involved in cell wall biosynthesis
MLAKQHLDNPLVSICCITYNHEKFISKAINGFLMQETNFSYEILIGEDCSTDNTREIVEKLVLKNPGRIRLFANEQNLGTRKNARNIRKNTRGKYIAVCEGDDYWTDRHKLQKQVNIMEKNPELSLCFHSAKVVTSRGIPAGTRFKPFNTSGIHNASDIIRIAGGGIPTQSKVYRKTSMMNLPEWHKNAHIGDMASDLYLSSLGPVYYINEPMSVYRLGAKGSWTRTLYSGPNLIEKKINMLKKDINLYDAFDEFTEYEHKETIEEIKTEILYGIEYLSNPFYNKSNTFKELSKKLSWNRKKSKLIKFSVLKIFACYEKLLNYFKKSD